MSQALLARLRHWLVGLIGGKSLRAELLRGGVGSVGIRAVGMGLSLAVAIVLARTLGPEGYGIYSYVFALISLLAIPVQFGLPVLVVRETARAHAAADWATLKGIWRWSSAAAGELSLLLAAAGGFAAWSFSDRFTGVELATFAWGLVLIPALVLSRLRGAALRGLRHIVTGQLSDNVVRQGLLVTLILAVPLLGWGGRPNASQAMALHALAAALAFLVGAILLRRVRPAESQRVVARYQHKSWTASALPLALAAGLQLANHQADILLLGFFTNAEQVGIYRVAVQGAVLVEFGLQAVNIVVAPQFARMHALGRHQQLQRLATASARAALAIALPVGVTFIMFGNELLSLVVGIDYVSGATPLIILTLGQIASAGIGTVVVLLNMTGHENSVTRGVGLALMINVGANIALIPLWGMNGAAAGTTLSIIIWASLLGWQVAKRLGVNSTFVG